MGERLGARGRGAGWTPPPQAAPCAAAGATNDGGTAAPIGQSPQQRAAARRLPPHSRHRTSHRHRHRPPPRQRGSSRRAGAAALTKATRRPCPITSFTYTTWSVARKGGVFSSRQPRPPSQWQTSAGGGRANQPGAAEPVPEMLRAEDLDHMRAMPQEHLQIMWTTGDALPRVCSRRGTAQETFGGLSAPFLPRKCTSARSYAACRSGPRARGRRSKQLETDNPPWRVHANHATAEPRRSELHDERAARFSHTKFSAAGALPAGAPAGGFNPKGAANSTMQPKTEGGRAAQPKLRIVRVRVPAVSL